MAMAEPTFAVTADEAATILLCVCAIAATLAFVWGMAVGTRDARLAADLERQRALELCADRGDLALRDVRSGAVICYVTGVAGQ